MSQPCDIPATRLRHRAGSVERMNLKSPAKTATLTALTALLAISLSACSLTLSDPGATTPPGPTPAPTTGPDESDGPINGGAFTDGECEDRDVEVKDDGATVILTGHCGVVNVTGSGTTVNIVDADSVLVTGLDNTIISEGAVGAVTISGGTNFYTGDSVGSIKVEGNENNVALNTADEVRLLGDTNFVQWSHGATAAEDSGTGNTVVAASAD
jgi:hypothetical protein